MFSGSAGARPASAGAGFALHSYSDALGLRPGSAPEVRPLLLAQGVASEMETDVPADAEASLAPVRGKATETAAAPRWFAWGIPPIRWGGQIITDLRADKTGAQPRRLQQVEIANIKASSYIWQPWFLRVNGGLGLMTSKDHSKESAGLAADQAQKKRSNVITGNAEAALFPVSRFPFNAYFDLSDSRASGEPSTENATSTRMGLRQSYRPPEGTDHYSASFNRSTLESSSFGRDTVNALAAGVHRSSGPQVFDLTGSHSSNTRSNTGESTAVNNLFARHSYRAESELSVENLASLSSSEFHLLSGGLPSDNRARFMQANTFATWRPAEGSPLFVTGGARVFQSSIAGTAAPTKTASLSVNLAATYRLSHQTTVSGSAFATQLQANGPSRLVTTQAASVNHVGNPAEIAGFAYTWNAAANAGNQTGLADGSQQNAGGQLGHNLRRDTALGEYSQLTFALGQDAGASINARTASTRRLNHNASLSWRVSSGAATSVYVSLMGSDSRTFGFNANHFQMINSQASGQMQFSRDSVAALNLTVQGVRQQVSSAENALSAPAASPDSSAPFNFNSSGNLSYSHLRAFGVPRLRYTTLYGVNESQFKSRLEGDVNAPRERVSQSFEQRLDYNIGRVAARLSMRIAMIEGRRDALIFFRLSREFGGY